MFLGTAGTSVALLDLGAACSPSGMAAVCGHWAQASGNPAWGGDLGILGPLPVAPLLPVLPLVFPGEGHELLLHQN